MAQQHICLVARMKDLYRRICEMFATLRLRNKEQNKRMSKISKISIISRINRFSKGSRVEDAEFISIFGDKRILIDDARLSDASSVSRIASLLTNIPAELHLKVFDYLDKNSSTCLGLTSRLFYGIHWSRHGIVDLNEYHNGLWLYEMLASYMAPRIPRVVRRNRKVDFVFMTREAAAELESGDQEVGREKWRRWLGRSPKGDWYGRFLE